MPHRLFFFFFSWVNLNLNKQTKPLTLLFGCSNLYVQQLPVRVAVQNLEAFCCYASRSIAKLNHEKYHQFKWIEERPEELHSGLRCLSVGSYSCTVPVSLSSVFHPRVNPLMSTGIHKTYAYSWGDWPWCEPVLMGHCAPLTFTPGHYTPEMHYMFAFC